MVGAPKFVDSQPGADAVVQQVIGFEGEQAALAGVLPPRVPVAPHRGIHDNDAIGIKMKMADGNVGESVHLGNARAADAGVFATHQREVQYLDEQASPGAEATSKLLHGLGTSRA